MCLGSKMKLTLTKSRHDISMLNTGSWRLASAEIEYAKLTPDGSDT